MRVGRWALEPERRCSLVAVSPRKEILTTASPCSSRTTERIVGYFTNVVRPRMSLAAIKRSALSVLIMPGATQVFRPFMRDRATVFMLHRFDGAPNGRGYPIAALRRTLAWLRAHHFPLISLADLVDSLERGDTPSRAVVFTIDDGYAEQATVAAPVFAEFDCPVTTFLTTGFIDGHLWLWWDRVDYLFSHTPRSEVSLEVAGRPFIYRWSGEDERFAANAEFVARCTRMPDAQKNSAITRLAA